MKKITSFACIILSSTFIYAQQAQGTSKRADTATRSRDIEEVVVVGFGKQKRQNVTGSISVISEKAIEGRPVNNVVDALKGTAAGMSFNTGAGGGQLDNTSGFNIRGVGTVGNTSSAPLVLIDGMEGDMSRINPRDVESVSVLKDAAAASVYGSRAAFGVILVTTKSGRKGKATITYDLMTRFSNPTIIPHMMESETFANYFNEALGNAGLSPAFSAEVLQNIRDYKSGRITNETSWNTTDNDWNKYQRSWANNNWFKEFYKQWAPATEHNVSVRGGTDKTTYYLSGNYLTQDGLSRYNPDKLNRYTLNGKFSAEILPFLNVRYSSRFVRSDYNRSAYMDGLFYHNIARRWPTLPKYDIYGNYVHGNEIPNLERSFRKNQQDFLDQQLVFVLSPVKGWDTNFEFNYRIENNTTDSKFLPLFAYGPNGEPVPTNYQTGATWDKPGGSMVNNNLFRSNFFNTNIYSTYSRTINDVHNFKLMAGMQAEVFKGRSFFAQRDQLLADNLEQINTTAGKDSRVGGTAYHWSTFGTFARLNYNYMQRYLIEGNMRLDATSRYLQDQRWRWYPSVSLGWNVARENFWDKSFLEGKITQFTLRASYGSLGNQNVLRSDGSPDYYPFFMSQPFTSEGGRWLLGGQRPNVGSVPMPVSALLTWERVNTANFGLDLTGFRNRLTAKFDYFIRNTLDMVGEAPELPAVVGLSTGQTPRFNNADMRTTGFELELSWRDRIGSDFSYGISGVLSDAQSTITRYNNVANNLGQYYVGRKLGEIWGFVTHGIAKTDEEMNTWLQTHDQRRLGANWVGGDIMYQDLNGDGIIDTGANTLDNPGDMKIIGNSTPRYNFGLNLDLRYKAFDFSVFFQGVGKRDFNLGNQPYFTGANQNMWQSAAFVEHLDYFRPENTTSPFGPNMNGYFARPVMEAGGKNYNTQTRWLQDASYVRLKNVQFGYNLPKEMLSNIGMSGLRIYLTGENLLTWTKLFKTFDPEALDGAWGVGKIYPLSKVVAVGLTANF